MNRDLAANIEYIHCCQKYLEGLLNRKDYHAAVRYFESMHNSLDNKSGAERGAFIRLGAQAYTGNGNPSRALGMIRSAIAILSDTVGDRSELGKAYMVLGDTLRELGEYDEAERAFRDAESIFRRDDNIGGAGDALNRLAGIFFRRGHFKNSLNCLLGAIEFARKEDKKEKLAYLFGNVGRIYTLLGRFGKAEENIKFNIELSRKLDDGVEMTRALLSLAYIYILRRQFDIAEEYLEQSKVQIDRHNLAKEEVIYLTYRGEMALAAKKYDAAEENLHEAMARGRKVAVNSYLAARPMRWMAEVKAARGNYRAALSLVNQIMPVMTKLGNAFEAGALQKVSAICMEKLNQASRAKELYLESISTLERYHTRVELAATLAAAGNSDLFDNSRKTMFLCRAEEIYSSLGASAMAQTLQKTIGCLHPDDVGPGSSNAEIETFDDSLPEFVTTNAKMKKIISQLKLLRNSDLPILLTGETGVGKDYLARYFHSISRPDRPYVAVNCAAIPDNLIESELFGYHKGAFTGAESNRAGLFRAANRGVLLLDEIGELPLTLQAKLLSILETRKLRPLGTTDEVELDIIIIAATNRDLSEMVEAGTFRQDLYYRLTGITLELPPLRERKEDIPQLLEFFMRKFGLLKDNERPEDELVSQFVNFDWPGNIRQLENKVHQLRAMVSITREGSLVELARSFFDDRIDEKTNSLFEQVEAFEKKLLLEALVSTGGNKSQAARMLSIHESTFRAKMKRYSLEGTIN